MQVPAQLVAHNLSKVFMQGGESHHILISLNQTFEQGKTYAIVGASGSGKSTLLHILGGLDTPTSGKVLFNGCDLGHLKADKKEHFLNQSLGFVFQFHYLINELTAFENVVIKGTIAGKSRKECELEASELFEYVGLSSKKELYPGQLSGGEQQRVAIMRALMNKPQFLLADEPTGNLDYENAQQIARLFMECNKKWGMAVIICSHDKAVYDFMEYHLFLENGVLSTRYS